MGCRRRRPQDELLRVARTPGGEVLLDSAGAAGAGRAARVPGRGVYVCAAERCVQRARRTGALRRALRYDGELPAALWEAMERVAAAPAPDGAGPREEVGHG